MQFLAELVARPFGLFAPALLFRHPLAQRGGLYTVPSLHGEHGYSVTYTAREESCSCRDWEFGHTCYHVLAAAVVRAKTGICAGCGHRFRHRELLEVLEGNHDNLTYFDGDLLCRTCADNAAVA